MVRSARLLFLVFLLPMTAAAQDAATSPASNASAQTPRARARIGVALEGGGALGLAHVGVLQWFEDHHIPIDYIAGTSYELHGNQYYLFRLGYLHDLFTLPPFLGKKIYAIGTYEFAKCMASKRKAVFQTTSTSASLPKLPSARWSSAAVTAIPATVNCISN